MEAKEVSLHHDSQNNIYISKKPLSLILSLFFSPHLFRSLFRSFLERDRKGERTREIYEIRRERVRVKEKES
jgi:hypothetical protein